MSNYLIKNTENTAFVTTDLYRYCGLYNVNFFIGFALALDNNNNYFVGLCKPLNQPNKIDQDLY